MDGAVDGQVLVRVGGENLVGAVGLGDGLGPDALFLVVAAKQMLLLLLLAQGRKGGAESTRRTRLRLGARDGHGEVAMQRHGWQL